MMPGERYTEVDDAFILVADGQFTVEEVARALDRSEQAVYLRGRALGITFKPKAHGSLKLSGRGAFVIPSDQVEYYQELVNRIGRRCGLASKSQVFLRALELAAQGLEDEENTDDAVRVEAKDE